MNWNFNSAPWLVALALAAAEVIRAIVDYRFGIPFDPRNWIKDLALIPGFLGWLGMRELIRLRKRVLIHQLRALVVILIGYLCLAHADLAMLNTGLLLMCVWCVATYGAALWARRRSNGEADVA